MLITDLPPSTGGRHGQYRAILLSRLEQPSMPTLDSLVHDGSCAGSPSIRFLREEIYCILASGTCCNVGHSALRGSLRKSRYPFSGGPASVRLLQARHIAMWLRPGKICSYIGSTQVLVKKPSHLIEKCIRQTLAVNTMTLPGCRPSLPVADLEGDSADIGCTRASMPALQSQIRTSSHLFTDPYALPSTHHQAHSTHRP